MIAPRKTLWSTPNEVVTTLMEWIPLKPNDVILDVGCGDAKVLLQWAQHATCRIKLVGIEIDENRATEARNNVERAYQEGVIDKDKVTIVIHCGNALEATDLYQEATIIFLYLIPRGLRIIKPLLMQACSKSPLQVVTYMSPLPDETFVAKKSCNVDHQPGAAWPLYLYHLQKKEDGV
jgi:SAM-dependent methyltransferase